MSDAITIVVLLVVFVVACWYVPRAARKLERDAYRPSRQLDPERFGWLHDHVDHVRHEPKPCKREPSDPEDHST